jgi:hypothetical protein
MAKQLLNEAERYLIEKWQDARLLEETMERVRTKYKELFDRIIDAVRETHPDLGAERNAVTNIGGGSGFIGLGKTSWPNGQTNWPSGMWVNNLLLENITTDDSDSPNAYIELIGKSKSQYDFDAARSAMNAAAKDLLTPEELKGTTKASSGGVLLWLPAPSKLQILEAFSQADGQALVQLFVSQFDMMARFIPTLDKVFRDCVMKE